MEAPMNSSTLEYTSHRHPEITRVQYEGSLRILGAFVVSAENADLALGSIWQLMDEALIQNTRYFSQKPIKLFILQFDKALRFNACEIVAASSDELLIRPTRFVPMRLRKAAKQLAERRIPFGPAAGGTGHD
jgi:hypothetical protein